MDKIPEKYRNYIPEEGLSLAVDFNTENAVAGSINGKCMTFPKVNDVLNKM